MRFLLLVSLFTIPNVGWAQSVDKYLHFSHGDYGRTTDYTDIYRLDFIREVHFNSDKECSEGYLELTFINGKEETWEYKDVCDIRDDFLDFLEDEDEAVFKIEWVPLDRQ